MTMLFDGREVPVRPGQTVAGALWAAGIRSWRTTRVAGRPRGLFCGIGACFDCLATIDGAPNRRACLVPARSGMTIASASATTLAPASPGPARAGSSGATPRVRPGAASATGPRSPG